MQEILKGEVSLYHWPPVWLVWNQLYDYWQFLFYLLNRLIQTCQTGGQQSSETSPFSIPCIILRLRVPILTQVQGERKKERKLNYFYIQRIFHKILPNLILIHRNDLVFKNLYENQLGKISAMVFSSVIAIITSPLILSLIRYQKNNHYRILIGHLITSNLLTLLHWDLSVQVYYFICQKITL